MTLNIIGAGMAGLLAANMLHRRRPVVFERQKSLPHNHSALLRFRSPVVGEVLGVPFRRVRVVKTTLPWMNPVADAMAYSRKTLGLYRTDRSVVQGTEVVDRWIAPPDLIERMAEGLEVRYDTDCDLLHDGPAISTIPMPSAMELTGYQPRPRFTSVRGCNVVATLPGCDAYVSMYFPAPKIPFYRASITGDQLVVECSGDAGVVGPSAAAAESMVERAIYHLGVDLDVADLPTPQVRHQEYGKIVPIDEQERRRFIFWMSTVRGLAFSLGRYGTWRPGLLLDDLVQDVQVIERMIEQGVYHVR